MSENHVLEEIESACSHYRICVLPRNPKSLAISVWSMPDPKYHVGVIWRTNTGAAKIGRRFIRFGLPGIPDFEGWIFKAQTGCISAFRASIEAKCGIAKETPNQRAYAILAQTTGVLHGVARSYDESCALLESWGLKRV